MLRMSSIHGYEIYSHSSSPSGHTPSEDIVTDVCSVRMGLGKKLLRIKHIGFLRFNTGSELEDRVYTLIWAFLGGCVL